MQQIIIEPYMTSMNVSFSEQIQVYCFNGVPKLAVKIHNKNEVSVYDENLRITDDIFSTTERNLKIEADNFIKQTFDLSAKLCSNVEFLFVRVDWMIYQNKLYFEELTFTPYSGFRKFKDEKYNLMFGNWLDLR